MYSHKEYVATLIDCFYNAQTIYHDGKEQYIKRVTPYFDKEALSIDISFMAIVGHELSTINYKVLNEDAKYVLARWNK
jgi:hypothetical protein